MNKPLMLFLLSLILFSCKNEQENQVSETAYAVQVDSTSIKKLMALNDSIEWAIRYDPNKALTYESELERLAGLVGKDQKIGSGFLRMGKAYMILGNRERARSYFSRSHDQFLDAGMEHKAALATIYIGMAYSDDGAYEKALNTFEEALSQYMELEDIQYQGHVYSHMAYAKSNMGDRAGSLAYNLKALETFEQVGDTADAAIEMANIAFSYAEMGELDKALEYYERSAGWLEEANFNVNLMGVLDELGEAHLKRGDFDLAKMYFDSTYNYARSFSNKKYMAAGALGLGKILKTKGDYLGALEKFRQALADYELVDEKVKIIDAYCLAADCLIKLGKPEEADVFIHEAGQLSKQSDSRLPYMTYLKSAESLDSARGAIGPAYWKFKEHISIRDSLFNMKNADRLAGLQFQYEVEKKELIEQAERANEKQRQLLIRNAILAALIASIVFGLIIFRQRNRIALEKERSEELLLNILPAEVAKELKDKGHSDAQLIDQVTVLFTDFKGFTALSEKVTPRELVKDLHACFSAFDHICEKHSIEKIKTIGDAYMAAGGLPVPNTSHALDVVKAALEMAKVLQEGKGKKIEQGLSFFEIRIGIHTGPVVAGIVGVKKFQYDIWGDTVNTASRMESSGEVGKVNISQDTYELLKDNPELTFESRGEIMAKGKGKIGMYFVSKT
jgi:class 3 adenylate cyclase/TolA-binding protein